MSWEKDSTIYFKIKPSFSVNLKTDVVCKGEPKPNPLFSANQNYIESCSLCNFSREGEIHTKESEAYRKILTKSLFPAESCFAVHHSKLIYVF